MKKLLLATLLIGVSLPNPLSATPQKISAKPPRKKSKESTILKAIVGSMTFCTQASQFLQNLNSCISTNYPTTFSKFFKQNALVPLLPLVFGTALAVHAFKELDEIAQEK